MGVGTKVRLLYCWWVVWLIYFQGTVEAVERQNSIRVVFGNGTERKYKENDPSIRCLESSKKRQRECPAVDNTAGRMSVGAEVEVRYDDGCWYKGTVEEVDENRQMKVMFSDGDHLLLQENEPGVRLVGTSEPPSKRPLLDQRSFPGKRRGCETCGG